MTEDWITLPIEKQIPELNMTAIQNYEWALDYALGKIPYICLDGLAFELVGEQTPDFCMIAVKQYGIVLYYIRRVTWIFSMNRPKKSFWRLLTEIGEHFSLSANIPQKSVLPLFNEENGYYSMSSIIPVLPPLFEIGGLI